MLHLQRFISAAALAFFALSVATSAQTPPAGFVIFTGSRIVNNQGLPLASGTLCAQISANGNVGNANVNAYSVQPGSGGATTKAPSCTRVTAGAFNTFLPDTNVSKPQNACVAISVISDKGDTILNKGYGCLQPTSAAPTNGSPWCSTIGSVTTCNLDLYQPDLPAVAVIQTGPQGLQGVQGISGPVGPMYTGYYDESSFTGANLTTRIIAWVAAMGTTCGVLNISHPGTVLDVNLGVCHVLHPMAAIAWNGLVTIGNRSGVLCDAFVQHTALNSADYVFSLGGADHAFVNGCSISAPYLSGGGPRMANLGGATFPTIWGNKLVNIGIANGNPTDYDIEHNDSINQGWTGSGLINLSGSDRGRILYNIGSGTTGDVDCILIYEANANNNTTPLTGWPFAYTQGNVEIAHNTCSHTQAAIFLSVVANANVHDNEVDNCRDTCLDDEGGINNTWHDNLLHDCNGGFCMSTFFETYNVSYTHNHVINPGAIVMDFKSPAVGYPYNNVNAVFQGNDIDCGVSLCEGYRLESMGNPIIIDGNTWHNAYLDAFSQFSGELYFTNNKMLFDAAASTTTPLIAFGPCAGSGGCLNGSHIIATGNTIRNTASGLMAGSIGLYALHYDFNGVTFYQYNGNYVYGFPTSIRYQGNSGNIGMGIYVFNNYVDGTSTGTGGSSPVNGISGAGNINRSGFGGNCNIQGSC